MKNARQMDRSKTAIEKMEDTMCLMREDLRTVKKKLKEFTQRQDRDAYMDEEVPLLQYLPNDDPTHDLLLQLIPSACETANAREGRVVLLLPRVLIGLLAQGRGLRLHRMQILRILQLVTTSWQQDRRLIPLHQQGHTPLSFAMSLKWICDLRSSSHI